MSSPHRAQAQARPYGTLLASFAAWKLFLFAIALGSTLVGDAYDTSAGLVVVQGPGAAGSGDDGGAHLATPVTDFGRRLVARFASWDAIYFVSIARRGYRFEQDWAFGAGLPLAVRGLLRGLEQLGLVASSSAGAEEGTLPEALAGIVLSNTAHLLSAFVLYRLGQVVWRDQTLSLIAALLHVISPAGLFLCAPNAESSFALLSFSGYLLFALSCRAEQRPACRDLYTVAAGAVFGLATAFRSNGILNGIPFAWEVLRNLPRLPRRPTDTLRRLLALGIGGVCVAAGSAGPQAVAYLRFCSGTSGAQPRPWCQGYLPSIYTFVQQHYWHTGFLRYWTLSNLPLFLLATPMLLILTRSGVEHLTDRRVLVPGKPAESARLLSLLQSAAAAQVLLAVLAVTSYHVQIITRISSGYPLWYWWVAGCLIRGEKTGSRIVMFMVIYASIQGALFTSFLPPA
ncbi:450d1c96-0cdd-4525-a3d1-aefd0f7013fd [Thermothielavioides terrestris]|uniref:GPI mannosyltransferase 2 n=2 Tax=Thermothielavioides terrestris TaxID=2587410 RepID=G2QRC8_THETT|nr:glycosyltransferase family 76 protein [Thermothielavioides terrestris NRRL 8126]AEO64180.1 glycosyltransferase family 76 protein [Thermothielavioides terrestris NRRL 8126]SPQ26965.1 450d1c96-0cdd-4525-a3d1-aefd0f7013fd [Thermothielavioides terrestris]